MIRTIVPLLALVPLAAAAEERHVVCRFTQVGTVILTVAEPAGEGRILVDGRPAAPATRVAADSPYWQAGIDGFEIRVHEAGGVEIGLPGMPLLASDRQACETVEAAPAGPPLKLLWSPGPNWSGMFDGDDGANGLTLSLLLKSSGEGGWNPTLLMSCQDGATSIWLSVPEAPPETPPKLEARIDDGAPMTLTTIAGHRALGLSEPSEILALFDALAASERLTVALAPLEATFDTSRFAEAVAPLRELCAW